MRQVLEVLNGAFGLIEEIKTPVVSGVGIRWGLFSGVVYVCRSNRRWDVMIQIT